MRDRKAAGEAVNKNPIRGTCFGCCAAARDGEARAKPTSQTTMIVFLPIRACLLRFIAGCPEPFFLPLLHWLWQSWQPLDSRSLYAEPVTRQEIRHSRPGNSGRDL